MRARRRSIWTRIGVIVLTLACGLGVRAYGFAGGTGEPNDPYQIATAADLVAVGADPSLLTKHFILLNDIDLDPNLPGGRVFNDALVARDHVSDVSVHSGDPFSGVLDGRGHTIHNLWISGRPGCDAGLFAQISGLVKDLHLRGVRVSGSPCGALAGLVYRGVVLRCSVAGQVSGSEDTGGLVGDIWDGTLIDCRSEVLATGGKCVGGLVGAGPGGTLMRCEALAQVQGDSHVGGLIGRLGAGQIADSRATGTVTGRDYVGGLVGGMTVYATPIIRSVADCNVTAERTAGGLVGESLVLQGPLIVDCRACGSVAGYVAGGLVGHAWGSRILNSYAACKMIPFGPPKGETLAPAVGGLFGDVGIAWPPLVNGCFWGTGISAVNLSVGRGTPYPGTGLAAEQMAQQDTFQQAGWDFGSTWVMSESGYPILRWELAAGAEPKPQE